MLQSRKVDGPPRVPGNRAKDPEPNTPSFSCSAQHRRRHHGSMSFPCNSCKHPSRSPGSSSSCWPPIEILTLLRNPAQSLFDKTDICYHEAGQPVPKGQLQAAPKGLCKAERGFLTAEASKKAAPTQEADGPLCLFHPYTLFFPS